jgi:hypothetical protein
MPATRAIISTRSNALDTLLTSPRCSFFEEVGNRFATWIDTFAPIVSGEFSKKADHGRWFGEKPKTTNRRKIP